MKFHWNKRYFRKDNFAPISYISVIQKWTELYITAVDTWQYPEMDIANSAISQSKYKHAWSHATSLMLSLLLFWEHNGNYHVTFSTINTVPLLQTTGNKLDTIWNIIQNQLYTWSFSKIKVFFFLHIFSKSTSIHDLSKFVSTI